MPIFLRWFLRLGPLNPIAVRLVQGGSRRARHFYIRAIYLGVLIACLLWALMLNSPMSSQTSLRNLASGASQSFSFVANLQIALICLLAPVFMAGAIAQEANPKTWDILLTTPLSPAEIVLGNLFGRLFFILALLVSSLPLFALTQYFGGVPGRSIFVSYAIAGCAALLVGSAAIALSVSRLVGKRAVFAFYVSVVSYLAVTFAVDSVVSSGTVTWMTGINPFLALRHLLKPTSSPAVLTATGTLAHLFLVTPVKAWCYLSAGLSVALMIVSTITVRMGGIAGLGGLGGRGGAPWYRSVFGLAAKGAMHRAPRNVWHNPIAWREAAARNSTFAKMTARWSFIGLGALFGLGIVLYFHGGGITIKTFQTLLLYTVLGELGVITLVAVNMSATSVAREREDGTLDLLLTTPLTSGAYLTGKLRGMIAYLLPLLAVPIGTLALAGIYVLGVQAEVFERSGGVMIQQNLSGSGGALPTVSIALPVVLPEAALLAAMVVIPFTAFAVMVGMHRSLQSKGSIGSVIATVGIVGVVAGILGLCAFRSGYEVPLIGPSLASLSPGVVVFASVYPWDGLNKTVMDQGLGPARAGLFIGAMIAAGVYLSVVYGIHAHMVRTFDMTVRKLAGTA